MRAEPAVLGTKHNTMLACRAHVLMTFLQKPNEKKKKYQSLIFAYKGIVKLPQVSPSLRLKKLREKIEKREREGCREKEKEVMAGCVLFRRPLIGQFVQLLP